MALEDPTSFLRDALPDDPSRDELEDLIVQRAINDATVWTLLVNPATTRQGLAKVFGAPPPPGVNVRVHVEDPSTFYHVVPAPEEAEIVAGPPNLAPRRSFQRRVNYLLRTDPAFKAAFEAHPPTAISAAFQFRFPSHVRVVPLPESTTTNAAGDVQYNLCVVLPYSAHDALFDSPYCLVFNGTDSSVSVAYSPSLDVHTLGVEVWFKAASYHNGNWQDPVVSMHGPASGWELRVGEAVPRFMVTIGGVHYYAEPTFPTPFLKTDTWYYLVGSYDGTALRLYLNGQLLYTKLVSGLPTTYPGPLVLGRTSHQPWDERYFAGQLDEVRVWSRAVSTDEIRRNRPKKATAAQPGATDSSLRAYYPMDEGTGPVLHDRSQYGNNGTLQRVQWATTPGDTP